MKRVYPKEGHKGNFLTNSPKRGRVKENIKNIEIKLTMTKPKKITLK